MRRLGGISDLIEKKCAPLSLLKAIRGPDISMVAQASACGVPTCLDALREDNSPHRNLHLRSPEAPPEILSWRLATWKYIVEIFILRCAPRRMPTRLGTFFDPTKNPAPPSVPPIASRPSNKIPRRRPQLAEDWFDEAPMKLPAEREALTRILKWAQLALFTSAALLLGYCGFALIDAWIFQEVGQPRFRPPPARSAVRPPHAPIILPATAANGLVGRIEIPRLLLSAIVFEEVDKNRSPARGRPHSRYGVPRPAR